MKTSSAVALIEIKGQLAFTTSLAIADGCKQQHKNTMALIRKFKSDFDELGKVAFETRLNQQGSPTEYAILNEDHATYLITLFRNNDIVRKFKLKLVKAFRSALNEINRLYADPPRKGLIQAKRDAHKLMTDSLTEFRESLGKETDYKQFMSENKMLNWIVTGKFEKINEQQLSNEDVTLLEKVRIQDAAMIDAGLSYDERKAGLIKFAATYRARRSTLKLVPS